MEISRKNVFIIAGATIASVIGSGFATGQEVLQFYSSYGMWSFGVAIVSFFGFYAFIYYLMKAGFDHKDDPEFNHYSYFLGKTGGHVYAVLDSLALLFTVTVLISGGGATLHEYFGINIRIACAIMAVSQLIAYLSGFDRLTGLISKAGPVIIVFLIAVGLYSVIKDFGNFADINECSEALYHRRPARSFFMSGILYTALNFFPVSSYFVKLGKKAENIKELKLGTLSGVLFITAALVIVSTSILLNGKNTASLEIPVLYNARRIGYIFAGIFSVFLVAGIFSSCTTIMWSFCSKLAPGDRIMNFFCAGAVTVFGFIMSFYSFGTLISKVYPVIGYAGIPFLLCVFIKAYKGRNLKREPSCDTLSVEREDTEK